MFTLNYSDHRPLYRQIKDHFKELIFSGALNEGDKVPSVRELASMLAINPNTIQKAYKELEAEGFISSVPAKGSFVSPGALQKDALKLEEMKKTLRRLIYDMRCMGEKKEGIIEEIEEIFKEGEK